LDSLPVHVNLIPYNPIAEAPQLRATPAARRQQFAAALRAAGFTVTLRYSLGADVAAACGQLARRGHAPSSALV
jgi:23S rRNA (adenine2503-C2)-methyltransferase